MKISEEALALVRVAKGRAVVVANERRIALAWIRSALSDASPQSVSSGPDWSVVFCAGDRQLVFVPYSTETIEPLLEDDGVGVSVVVSVHMIGRPLFPTDGEFHAVERLIARGRQRGHYTQHVIEIISRGFEC